MKRLLRGCVWVVLFGALLEGSFRLAFPVPEVRGFNRLNYRPSRQKLSGVTAVRSINKVYESVPDGARFAQPLNFYGFRGGNWKLAAPRGVRRLMFVGDSFVEGVMAGDADTIPAQFEALARGAGEPVEALNFGISGVGFAEEFRLVLDAVPLFNPDWVVWVMFANDFGGDPTPPASRAVRPSGGGLRILEVARMLREREMLPFRWRFRDVREFQPVPHPTNPFSDPAYERDVRAEVSERYLALMKRGGANPYLPGINYWYERSLAQEVDVRAELEAVSRFLAARGTGLLVAYVPHRRQVSNDYKRYEEEYSPDPFDMTQEPYQAIQRSLAGQCAAAGIPFVDVSDAVRAREESGEHLYWPYDGHFTPGGNRLVASALHAEWGRLARAGAPRARPMKVAGVPAPPAAGSVSP